MSTRLLHCASRESGVRVEQDADGEGRARISLQGCLDDASGRSLLEAVDSVANDGGQHIRVDLRAITGYTQDGVSAASDCCRMASKLPCGVTFLVCAGTSRTALLEVFARG